jgi:hypothetical protein
MISPFPGLSLHRMTQNEATLTGPREDLALRVGDLAA